MAGNDAGTKACRIDVLIDEHEERTRAKARLACQHPRADHRSAPLT
ncbi:hypothetical protein OQ968_09850 [Mycobacterium sp. 663a-19]|nr:hypothetical protein [Mycobacterium sp. 663a-19]MEB3981567.1 hypothetical protein [Mycobacterium sp. 663a-19]